MAQKIYYHDSKRYFEVRVFKRSPSGQRLRQKTKFDSKGNRISSKKVADQIEYELKKELDSLTESSDSYTWKRWHRECLKRMRLTLKESTAISYDGGLTKWLPKEWREKDIAKISRNDVFELIFESIKDNENSNPRIQRAVLKKIRRIFQMAIEEGIIARNPSVGITVKVPPPVKKVLNSNQANSLLWNSKDCNHRCYYQWAFALLTGMRNGEIYTLRWSDIDFETGLISVTKQWTSKDGLHPTKGNRNRVVPISPELKELLLELKQLGSFKETLQPGVNKQRKASGIPHESEPVTFDDLVLPRYPEWKRGEQAKVLKGFCRQIGITEIKFHDLRATFITNLLSQGVSLAKTMAIVGHSEIATTNEYLRLAGVDIKKDTTEKLGYTLQNEHAGNVVNLYSNQ